MKKIHLLGGIVNFLVFPLCLCTAILANRENTGKIDAFADSNPYSITVNSTVFNMSSLTTTYQQNVTQQFGEDKPVMNYFLAKKDGSNNLVLAPAGKVFNYSSTATYKGRITNIISITVNYSGGALFVQEGIGGDATQYGQKVSLASGAPLNMVTNPNHIMISNSSAETTITSMTVNYSCGNVGFSVDRLSNIYTARGADSGLYTLTRSGANVSINNGAMTGTIAVNENGVFTITLASGAVVYTGNVSSDCRTLTITGKSGAGAASAPTIQNMKAGYVVADFENYADRGVGFTADQASIFAVSNLRGDYYVDAGSGSGNTWVSGSSFKIPNTSNYLNLCTTLAHSGSNSMLLQGQKAGWVRLWNSEVFNQSQQYNFGSGNRLSFWVHSGRNNPDGSGVNSSNVKLRVQVYYENFILTDGTRNSVAYGCGAKNFTVNTDTGWNECVLNIDPNKSVYAINIMIDNSGLATDYVFMPIDDITIYTDPIYEDNPTVSESSTMITKTYNGNVSLRLGLTTSTFTFKVGLGANGYIYAYCAVDMKPTGYTINGSTIVITTEGDYSGISFGNWTGTLSNNNSTITIQKANIDGDIKSYITTNAIVLNEDTVVARGSEGNSSLQSIFTKQYKDINGSWTNDPNGDKLTSDSTHYIEGSNSIRLKPFTVGGTRIIVNPTVAETQSLNVSSVAFWFYVPKGANYTITLYSYNAYNPIGAGYDSPAGKTYKNDGTTPDGWIYINCGLKDGYNKNFAIYVDTTSVTTYVDYITYF